MANWKITDNKFDFSLSHTINASGETVYRVLADMESYPEFLNDLVSVRREGEMYYFVARAALLTIPATLRVRPTPGQSVAFELVEGPIDRLNGRWLIEAGDTPGQTAVTLTIHAETGGRGEWLLRMTAKFIENKTDKLIAAFSNRVVDMERGGVTLARPAAESKGVLAWLKQLWQRIFGPSTAPAPAGEPVKTAAPAFLQDAHNLQTLEALAATLLPADDFDSGVKELGFTSVVEMRARYEAGRAGLYATALKAVDDMARKKFNRPNFVSLTAAEQTALLDAIRQDDAGGADWGPVKPSSFFEALWEDTVFLYCTHPDTWRRIGFPGPAHQAGGYGDFDKRQEFLGARVL